jgi:DNA-binding transcriptional LysR family regulator
LRPIAPITCEQFLCSPIRIACPIMGVQSQARPITDSIRRTADSSLCRGESHWDGRCSRRVVPTQNQSFKAVVRPSGNAGNGSDTILTIGRSPYANHDWVSALLAIRLPLYPRLEIRLKTQLAMESVHSVLVGEVNLALVTAPPEDTQITAVPFTMAPLYAVLPENHPAAHKGSLVLQDLAKDEWILFPKRFDTVVFEAIMEAAQCGSIAPKHAHDVIAPQQAVELVSEHLGVAILTQPSATGFHADGVVVKPLSDTSLCFKTCVILRADNNSRLVEEYVRMFLRKYAPQPATKAGEIVAVRPSLGLENANPAVAPLTSTSAQSE